MGDDPTAGSSANDAGTVGSSADGGVGHVDGGVDHEEDASIAHPLDSGRDAADAAPEPCPADICERFESATFPPPEWIPIIEYGTLSPTTGRTSSRAMLAGGGSTSTAGGPRLKRTVPSLDVQAAFKIDTATANNVQVMRITYSDGDYAGFRIQSGSLAAFAATPQQANEGVATRSVSTGEWYDLRIRVGLQGSFLNVTLTVDGVELLTHAISNGAAADALEIGVFYEPPSFGGPPTVDLPKVVFDDVLIGK